MKLAVTGCNGSIGSRVVLAALAQGHNVLGIDSTKAPAVLTQLPEEQTARFVFHEADLRDYELATRLLQGCEGVVHLAAMRTPGDYHVDTHNTNVVISWNILRAAAELGIKRVAQASSVNVVPLVWTDRKDFEYFPLDEDHPTRVDEPYGLSKVYVPHTSQIRVPRWSCIMTDREHSICELQADVIVRRYPSMRVASLRLSWSVASREHAKRDDPERRKNDLWGYVQEDSGAEAFLLAVVDDSESGRWSGHERFFITAPDTASDVPTMELYERYWRDVRIKEGKDLSGHKGFFDCAKAERLLGWKHRNPGE